MPTDSLAEVLRGKGLADPRNVVVFTFHSEQSHAPYGSKVHRHGAMLHFAFRQGMFDKHGIDGLQKEFGGQIHDRPLFIIKFAVSGRRISIASDKMIEEVEMRVDVTIDIHRQKAREL